MCVWLKGCFYSFQVNVLVSNIQHITQILERKHFAITKDCYCSFHDLAEIPGNSKEVVGL